MPPADSRTARRRIRHHLGRLFRAERLPAARRHRRQRLYRGRTGRDAAHAWARKSLCWCARMKCCALRRHDPRTVAGTAARGWHHRADPHPDPRGGAAGQRLRSACIATARPAFCNVDTLIWAIGRDPNTDALNLAAAGVRAEPGRHDSHRSLSEHQRPRHLRHRRRHRALSSDAGRHRCRPPAGGPAVRPTTGAPAALRKYPQRGVQPSADWHDWPDRRASAGATRRRGADLSDPVPADVPRLHRPPDPIP
jgi:hypothetical protein